MIKLDFSIPTSKERMEFIKKYMDDTCRYTKKELETISNYILYGKDEDGTSIVDRKEIQIKPKHNSYTKRNIESLDSLLESPTFKEEQLSLNPIKYRNPKPTIDHQKDADIPGMRDLWGSIEEMDKSLQKAKELKDNNKVYELTHALIEMRRQQYTLKEIFNPTICKYKTGVQPTFYENDDFIDWDELNGNYSIAPLGLITSNPKRFYNARELQEKDYHYNEKATYIIDFRNENHIYWLYEFREEIETEAERNSLYILGDLLKTLDFYAEAANLSEKQKLIIELKTRKIPNAKIAEIINKKFGTNHCENYISTLYKQQICRRIAEACRQHYDEYMCREIPTAWKKCSKCGEWKLVNNNNFAKRAKSADGFASICKSCDKIKRGEKKIERNKN